MKFLNFIILNDSELNTCLQLMWQHHHILLGSEREPFQVEGLPGPNLGLQVFFSYLDKISGIVMEILSCLLELFCW